jgi:hypothetical protein
MDIVLDDPSQLPAAVLLFQSLYEVPTMLQAVEQPTLIHLMLLANKYDTPAVLKAAKRALEAQDLNPEAMKMLWELPGTWEPPFWQLLAS